MATLAGFWTFVRNQMKISTADLPDDDPVVPVAYAVALEIVSLQMRCVSSLIYDLAVYNLAGDRLLNYGQDQEGRTFFADARKAFHLTQFLSGVVSSTSDVTTATTIMNPEFMKGLTLSDLQRLKTPYGRQYLEFAQEAGSLWGLS